MTKLLLLLCLLLGAVFVDAGAATVQIACYHEGQVTLDCDGVHPSKVVASAFWEDVCNTTGWGDLRVQGHAQFPMEIQARGMGLLEGFLTQERIFQAKANMFAHAFGIGKPASPKVAKFYEDQLAYVRQQVVPPQGGGNMPVWGPLAIVMAQFDGLVEGYNLAAPNEQKITELDLYIHNGAGDLEDLGAVLPGVNSFLPLASRFAPDVDMLDCSSFISFDKKSMELVAGHTTWRDYPNMAPRAYKLYQYNSNSTRQLSVSFSSTPGFLSSKDDFYIVSSPWSHFVVMETTNAVFDAEKYKLLTPESIFTWQRTMIANMIAESGKKWTKEFAKGNSGTYNNQWMVLDLNVHKKHVEKMNKMKEENNHAESSPLFFSALAPHTLWILEQIPGMTEAQDVTPVLASQGYWASYNIPYFPSIYNESGYAAKNGSQYSYTDAPRAKIFAERGPKAKSLDDVKFLMQYNDYKNDPLSLGSPLYAISSRFDLVGGPDARAFGGIDSKVTTASLASKLSAHIISGPTQQQAPFSWSTFTGKAPVEHLGQVDKFSFPWLVVVGDEEKISLE